MFIIGLTGGLATGKSTVAQMFVGLGAHLIDADQIARSSLEPGTLEFKAVVDLFGEGIVDAGRINRSGLAQIVFKDPQKLKQLEAVVHPFVRQETKRLVAEIERKAPGAVVVWDVPLLFEKNLEKEAHATVVVDAGQDQQIERAVQRLKITRDDAIQRIERQMPMKDKIQRADFVVRNEGSLDHTRDQVHIIWAQLKNQTLP